MQKTFKLRVLTIIAVWAFFALPLLLSFEQQQGVLAHPIVLANHIGILKGRLRLQTQSQLCNTTKLIPSCYGDFKNASHLCWVTFHESTFKVNKIQFCCAYNEYRACLNAVASKYCGLAENRNAFLRLVLIQSGSINDEYGHDKLGQLNLLDRVCSDKYNGSFFGQCSSETFMKFQMDMLIIGGAFVLIVLVIVCNMVGVFAYNKFQKMSSYQKTPEVSDYDYRHKTPNVKDEETEIKMMYKSKV